MSDVQLTISKEIVTPIVEAKIREAISAAFGGVDTITRKIVDQVLSQKVDNKGQISIYSSENRHNWIDIVVTNQIKAAVQGEIAKVVQEQSGPIRDAIITQLRTKAGASAVAKALVASIDGTLKSEYKSSFKLEFAPVN